MHSSLPLSPCRAPRGGLDRAGQDVPRIVSATALAGRAVLASPSMANATEVRNRFALRLLVAHANFRNDRSKIGNTLPLCSTSRQKSNLDLKWIAHHRVGPFGHGIRSNNPTRWIITVVAKPSLAA
jgi:hypothetical protein